jgi:hypothetical protein
MTVIDTKTGELKFDVFFLGRTTRQADIEKFVINHSTFNTGQSRQFALGSHTAQGKRWGLGAVVRNEKVVQFWLQCLDAEGVVQDAWDMNNEERRQAAHEEYMRMVSDQTGRLSNGGRQWQFSWGKISSTLDLKGVQALLIVDYAF